MIAGSDARPIGIIGVGAIGLAIARRLIAAGYRVNGYRRGNLDDFVAAGGIGAASAAGVTADSGLLILLVPGEAGLSAVMAEIAPWLRPDQIVICLATHRVEAKRRAAAAARAAGAVLLDGEISGTPAMVEAGQATVMIAGDPDAIDRSRTTVGAFAARITGLAAFGDAVRMKLVTNYLVGVHTAAAAEALQMGRRLGLAPDAILEAVIPSAGGSTMLAVRGPMMAAGDFSGGDVAGFLGYFDLLRGEMGNDPTADWPLLEATASAYRRAIDNGYGDRDIAAVYRNQD